ncbi:MAG: TlpA family protein disulfide reductase [Treponema sp.]|jgi:thiol-disulfide isomerase/thioredoxin|nr:TlpA family protein disulfide reductase [Treponema sp.]
MNKQVVLSFLVLAIFFPRSVAAAPDEKSIPLEVKKAFVEAGVPVLRQRVPSVDFSAPLISGNTQQLKALEGKVVFLNFWASWCGPCRSEMPSMDALYRRLNDQGLEIFAVNCQETQKDVASFMKNYNLSFPAALDLSGEISAIYRVDAFPTTYIIDRKGEIIARVVGSVNWNTPKLVAAFETLLKSSE